jgi:Tfp pilus assembly protein PilX
MRQKTAFPRGGIVLVKQQGIALIVVLILMSAVFTLMAAVGAAGPLMGRKKRPVMTVV